jgi:GT2 family glycosyltransferase
VATFRGGHADAVLPISVVIPAYRRADLVGRAVASALAQHPAEVIVVDDGSDDGTAAAARAAGATVVQRAENGGIAAARNDGIAVATQDWVALLDSDDEWLPGHLERVWNLREGYVLIADSSISTSSRRLHGNPRGPRRRILTTPAEALWPSNPAQPSSVLFSREVALAVGGFRTRPFAEDLEFWVRLLEVGPGLSLREAGSLYYEHPGQLSAGRSADLRAAVGDIATMHASRPWNTPQLRQRLQAAAAWDQAVQQFRDGRRRDALRAFARLAAGGRRDVAASATLASWRLQARLRGRWASARQDSSEA